MGQSKSFINTLPGLSIPVSWNADGDCTDRSWLLRPVLIAGLQRSIAERSRCYEAKPPRLHQRLESFECGCVVWLLSDLWDDFCVDNFPVSIEDVDGSSEQLEFVDSQAKLQAKT